METKKINDTEINIEELLKYTETLQKMVENTPPFGVREAALELYPLCPTSISEEEFREICSLEWDNNWQKAIKVGEELLEQFPSDHWLNFVLMGLYFKNRKEDTSYLEKSTECARQVVLYGFLVDNAARRLVINLIKQKRFLHAEEACNVIIQNAPDVLMEQNMLQYFKKKKEFLGKKRNKGLVNLSEEKLFTEEELTRLRDNIEKRKKANEEIRLSPQEAAEIESMFNQCES